MDTCGRNESSPSRPSESVDTDVPLLSPPSLPVLPLDHTPCGHIDSSGSAASSPAMWTKTEANTMRRKRGCEEMKHHSYGGPGIGSLTRGGLGGIATIATTDSDDWEESLLLKRKRLNRLYSQSNSALRSSSASTMVDMTDVDSSSPIMARLHIDLQRLAVSLPEYSTTTGDDTMRSSLSMGGTQGEPDDTPTSPMARALRARGMVVEAAFQLGDGKGQEGEMRDDGDAK